MYKKKNGYIKQLFLLTGYLLVFCLSFGATILFLQRYDVKITPKKSSSGMKLCTMDAKQCPDGSFVGRTGPQCEFRACPDGDTNKITTFKECSDAGYVIQETYPRSCRTPEGNVFQEIVLIQE